MPTLTDQRPQFLTLLSILCITRLKDTSEIIVLRNLQEVHDQPDLLLPELPKLFAHSLSCLSKEAGITIYTSKSVITILIQINLFLGLIPITVWYLQFYIRLKMALTYQIICVWANKVSKSSKKCFHKVPKFILIWRLLTNEMPFISPCTIWAYTLPVCCVLTCMVCVSACLPC